jgi:Uma2 family endonuclease
MEKARLVDLEGCGGFRRGVWHALMNPILELPEVRSRAVPLSVVAYEWMTAKGLVAGQTELIHGIVVEKMSKSPLHAQITDRLFKLIFLAVGDAAWVRCEAPVVLVDSVPEPDVSVVTGQDTDYAAQHPRGALLVVEVAVSSETIDREMASAYASGGVGEYWLVLAKSSKVECYSNPSSGVYQTMQVAGAGLLNSVVLPGVSVDLGKVFPAG